MAVDSTDRAIIEALCQDARLSQRQLAKVVGVAQGTITNRLRKLEADGTILGYAPLLNADSVGWGMTVMAGLCIEKGKIMDVQRQISADYRVFSVYDVTGDWDSMVLARVKNRADLDDLTKAVFTLEGITRSYTHVVLNTVKESGVRLPEE
ncbi:MAG: Lrp/AsnC family transcriptional regulator [Euryarchaeota archaeon]|jgi:DNA-binding Lrp family transcriptional regulator|nr:Lrp/AsnC family transcriptional regulator [Euryarchaeota archaeon]MBT4982011.1 Lrp/AsnC family transcriptional regulator [Euryarchaeota archaeon]MBT5183985.1 Lrp/AsnC family transcriptional regulator [Euryarchaeota archaeon]